MNKNRPRVQPGLGTKDRIPKGRIPNAVWLKGRMIKWANLSAFWLFGLLPNRPFRHSAFRTQIVAVSQKKKNVYKIEKILWSR